MMKIKPAIVQGQTRDIEGTTCVIQGLTFDDEGTTRVIQGQTRDIEGTTCDSPRFDPLC